MSYLTRRASGPLSSNGDSSSDDDEVFLNSRLDMFGRQYDNSKSKGYSYLELQGIDCGISDNLNKQKMSSPFSTPRSSLTPKGEQDAIIFSINFCGKNFGEVGLLEPDISVLDWDGFKMYLFSSLNLESPENFVISYSDGETDKIPIESEAEYREALKIAKEKASHQEKFRLDITRNTLGFPGNLRSLVSSSIRRVNSVGNTTKSLPLPIPEKKDVTTSTSFNNLRGSVESLSTTDISEISEDSDGLEMAAIQGNQAAEPLNFIVDVDTKDSCIKRITSTREKIWSRLGIKTYKVGYHEYDRRPSTVFGSRPLQNLGHPAKIGLLTTPEGNDRPTSNNTGRENEISFYCTFNCHLDRLSAQAVGSASVMAGVEEKQINPEEDNTAAPLWFKNSMQQLKDDISQEISSRINERFEDLVGNMNVIDVEERLRGVIAGYGSDVQERVICCCKGKECKRETAVDEDMSGSKISMESDEFLVSKLDLDVLKEELEKREREILSFIDETNQKIKRKVDLLSNNTQGFNDLNIEERDRVLTRIEDFRQRQSKTADELGRLHAAAARPLTTRLDLTSRDPSDKQYSVILDYDAKFLSDENFPDGTTVSPGEIFSKSWRVMNSGAKLWDRETFLICNSHVEREFLRPLTVPIQCPSLLPGEKGRVTISFQAPKNPGTYYTQWKFCQDGRQFGNLLWCSVQVCYPEEEPQPLLDGNTEALNISSRPLKPPPEYRLHNEEMSDSQDAFLLQSSISSDLFEAENEHNILAAQGEQLNHEAEELLQRLFSCIRVTRKVINCCSNTESQGVLKEYLNVGRESQLENFRTCIDLELGGRNGFVKRYKDELSTVWRNALTLTSGIDTSKLMSSEEILEKLAQILYERGVSQQSRQMQKTDPKKEAVHVEKRKSLCNGVCEESELQNNKCSVPTYSAEDRLADNAVEGTSQEEQSTDSESEDSSECTDEESESEFSDELSDENYSEESSEDEQYHEERQMKPELAETTSSIPDYQRADKNEEEADTLDTTDDFEHVVADDKDVVDSDKETESKYDIVTCKEVDGHQERINGDPAPDNIDIAEREGNLSSLDEDSEDEAEPLSKDLGFEEDSAKIGDGGDTSEDECSVSCKDDISSETTPEERRIRDSFQPVEKEESLAAELAAAFEDLSPERASSSKALYDNEETRKREISVLQEHFKQNVEVNLDFEIISQALPSQEDSTTNSPKSSSAGQIGPLTFMEKHFTLSHLPPPNSIRVPESDDDSDDGMVFIKNDKMLSSSAADTPSEDQVFPGQPVESDRCVSCSSLSDCKDADDDDEIEESDNQSVSCSSFSGVDEDDLPDSATADNVQMTSRRTLPECFNFNFNIFPDK